ncbi:translation initiation factor Sui1 [Sedimentisphaera cyanobacteriorum]|uniref:Translation initiation factor Sui1 n=1 Tax=Sedimentisphaera cyanobacteriorum TaxID=1940790 RepID=A0A1Q2HPE6_9BACT|nr:translation initiation factor Sui1 [Sedimentisphaera cyanobacteriorum]AQQ09329.1 translation initiation factor Sui1 [Sedimentisphaera cyanobacteriorum]
MNDRIVFSTDSGRMCPECDRPLDECICSEIEKPRPTDGIVRIKRETKGRKGKGMSVITGLGLTDSDLKELTSELKKKCGCGGSMKEGRIEIQGEKRDQLEKILKDKGYKVKQAGG